MKIGSINSARTKKFSEASKRYNSDDLSGRTKPKKNAVKPAGIALALLLLASCGPGKGMGETQINKTDIYSSSRIGSSVQIDDAFSIDTFNRIDVQGANDDLKAAQMKANDCGNYMKGVKMLQKAVNNSNNVTNGYLDEPVVQGIVSDCWLLTAAENLSYTPAGAKILHDAISTDNDGNVTVYFKGPDLTYTVTQEEMFDGNESYTLYSFGDDDMLALEIAAEKFRQDIIDGKIKIDKSLPEYMYDTNADSFSPLNMGEIRQGYWLLAGITEAETGGEDNQKAIEFAQKFKLDPKHSLLDLEFKKDFKVTDQNGQKAVIKGYHGYGVKAVDDETITLVSATNSQYEMVLPIEILNRVSLIDSVYCQIGR